MTSIAAQLDLSRYHRQALLPDIGDAGQQKLAGATALVVGCGALGTVITNMLARAGVGHLKVVDRDYVELTNLQRQVLFDEKDVADGIPKAEAARRKIAEVNSQVQVTPIVDDLNHTNIENFVQGCDVIVDGVDNFETRYLINDAAVKNGVPYVYGGAVGTVGATYAILPHTPASDSHWERAGIATPCLRCIFEQMPPPGMNPTCETAGVLGPVVSIIANYQCVEVLKILTENWNAVNRALVHVDVWHNKHHQFKVGPVYDVSDCQCCQHRNFEHLHGLFESRTSRLCGANAVQLKQTGGGHAVDFEPIAQGLAAHGQVKVNEFMLRASIVENGSKYELTLFNDGRTIIKGTTQTSVARSLYAKYVGS